jgi:hypothetical protein
MRLTRSSAFILGTFVCVILWWYSLQVTGKVNTLSNYNWNLAFNILPFAGGLFGIFRAYKWGFLKSIFSKALFFLSLGLFSWGIGNVVWAYYNLALQVAVPYPSLADIGFAFSYPLFGIGMFYLSIATGARYGLRTLLGKLQIVLLPVIAFVVAYYFFITIAREGVLTTGEDFLKTFFDIAYPVGDVIVLSLAFLVYGLSLQFLGGRYRAPVLIILAGFVLEFIADFSFSYTTTVGYYYVGSYPDLLFTIALFVLGFGLNSFDHKPFFRVETSPAPSTVNQTPDTILVSRIIKAQESYIGSIALDYAREIEGLRVYSIERIEITGDVREVLDRLVREYSRLFGKVAVEVCKEEVKKLASYPPEHLPDILK